MDRDSGLVRFPSDVVLKPGGHNPKVPTITWISAFDYMPKAVDVRMFQKGNHYKWDSTHHKGVELIGNFVIILPHSIAKAGLKFLAIFLH